MKEGETLYSMPSGVGTLPVVLGIEPDSQVRRFNADALVCSEGPIAHNGNALGPRCWADHLAQAFSTALCP